MIIKIKTLQLFKKNPISENYFNNPQNYVCQEFKIPKQNKCSIQKPEKHEKSGMND